jgi:asparagine synthase (glutamine-hydrolysing)
MMAAICGKLSVQERVTEAEINESLEAMPLRGSTIQRVHVSENFGIGSARRDSAHDGGLVRSEDGKVWMACDGDIFNLPQLRKEHQLEAASDLEILPRLYQIHGEEFITKLDGNFAIALWDEMKGTLILARDYVGTKPLYYTSSNGAFAFASEVNGLLALHDVERAVDLKSLDSYLTYLYVPAPNTLFREISQLKAGQICIFKDGKLINERVYVPGSPARFDREDPAAWAAETRSLLEGAIKRRLDGAGKVGFLLSGGADTAAILGSAAKFLPGTLKTFTLGFPECPESDERGEARKTAKYFNTDHTEFEVDHSCIATLPDITRHLGAPVGNPASLISFFLFSQVRNSVDAVACGDGGNEIFGGHYKFNQTMTYVSSLTNPSKQTVQAMGQKIWHQFRGTKLEPILQKGARFYFDRVGKSNTATLNSSAPLNAEQYADAVDYFALMESAWTGTNRRSLYSAELNSKLAKHDPYAFMREFFVHDNGLPVPQQVVYARNNTFIPYNALPYVEFNAVANGVTPLFPLLDKTLLEFMYKIPYEYIYGKSYRYFMEYSLGDSVIPSEIFRRPLKGFNTPIDNWLKTPRWREMINDYLSPESVKARGWFSPEYVQNLVSQYYSGKKTLATEYDTKVQPLSLSIWTIAALEAWCREYRVS